MLIEGAFNRFRKLDYNGDGINGNDAGTRGEALPEVTVDLLFPSARRPDDQ
jgi:hypothetical protein